MKRVFLFNPPTGLYRRDNRCQNRVEDQTVNVVFPPMELLYPASILEKAGHEVQVRDYPALKGAWDQLIADLQEIQPDIAILTVTIATLDSDLQSAEMIKTHCPNALIAIKGEPGHHLDKEIIQNTKHLDIILRGEVDGYIADFVDGISWDELPEVTYLQDGQVIRTDKKAPWVELDSLPFPARHLIDNSLYISPETHNPLTTIVTSLGCPHKCIFCSIPITSGVNVRYRSAESVVDEIEECINRYGIREFLFHADTFTLKKQWIVELCTLIIKKKLDIRWGCNSRVNTIDEERLIWMKRAGCWVIGFGVESGNDQHLEAMKKSATGDEALQAIRLCRKHNIRSHAFFVFGFPWDTNQSISELITFARKLDPDFFDFNVAFPLPGTELERMLDEKNLVVKERLRSGGYAVSAVSTETLSSVELEKWRKWALWKMYLRPIYILRTLRNAGSPKIALNYMRAAMGRISNLLRSSSKR